MNNIILILVMYYIFAVILITATLNIIEYSSKKRYKREVENLDIEKNQVIDAPIMTELSKVENLTKVKSIDEKYNVWKNEIDKIKEFSNKDLNDMIIEADFLIDQKSYKDYIKKRTNIEIRLYEMEELKARLLEEIKEITLSEERNRVTITDLKTKFRNTVKIFEDTKIDFEPVDKTIELQIENIEKMFQDFEMCMEKEDYIEANKMVSVLNGLISHLETIIDEIPGALLMALNIIPKRLTDLKIEYQKMIRKGYQLDYLNVEYNIEEIEKKIQDIMAKIRVLNLEDAVFDLKTMLEYTDSVFNDFEKEKIARKSFEESVNIFKSKAYKINDFMNKLSGRVKDAKYNYKLSETELISLDSLNEDLLILEEDFTKLYDTTKTSSFPYTRLTKELEMLIIKLSEIEEKLDKYIESIGNMQEDEKRAREQLTDMTSLLESSKHKMREYKLPIIPNNYFIELKEANEAIREIVKELDKKPINIDVLNTRVDTARDLVFKIHNTSNELIKTAQLAETAIIYGNRYRTKKQYVDDGLNKAEILFIKGEYKKSLELSLNTIDIIEPGIYKKLLNLYEKNAE
ncbi:septation ring formation regulator EzrA [Clostridium sp. CAG:1193]|nr:septation ring formation regulator EzrA [Clostridium sp. CAG:1193]